MVNLCDGYTDSDPGRGALIIKVKILSSPNYILSGQSNMVNLCAGYTDSDPGRGMLICFEH